LTLAQVKECVCTSESQRLYERKPLILRRVLLKRRRLSTILVNDFTPSPAFAFLQVWYYLS
ncbi:MAG: hypothetical protein IKS70_00025, partial [Bacteroides sp.]|nr:hypothetical protein [Bacteroides sp.]